MSSYFVTDLLPMQCKVQAVGGEQASAAIVAQYIFLEQTNASLAGLLVKPASNSLFAEKGKTGKGVTV